MSDSGKRAERRTFWLHHVEACASSGQGVPAYARDHALSAASLYRWRRKLRGEGRADAGARRWARVATPRSGHPAPALYRITLPDGAVVELGGRVDASELEGVLAAATRR